MVREMVDCLRGQQSSRKDTQRAARLLRLSYDATERNVSTAPEGPPLRTPPPARVRPSMAGLLLTPSMPHPVACSPYYYPKHVTTGSLLPTPKPYLSTYPKL